MLAVFSAYLDESKNSNAFVIGGWLCSDDGSSSTANTGKFSSA
jgi:hypothetical protein